MLCREWFTSFYSSRYRKVWAHSKGVLHSPSLLPLFCVHPYFWKCRWKLLAWHHWIIFFSIKAEEDPVVAGHAVQDTLPVSYLPRQAAPPACPSRVLFLRTPTATFGLIYRAKDLSFGTQPQHIHSLGTELLLSQTGPIPYSPLCHCLGVWVTVWLLLGAFKPVVSPDQLMHL